jgi:hypothetical protein
LDATQRSLHDLEKKHSEVLGELAGRERGIADKGSELEKLQKDHARAVAERDAMLAAKDEMLTTVRGEAAEKSQALSVATEETLRLKASLTALSEEITSIQTNTISQAARLLRELDAVRRIYTVSSFSLFISFTSKFADFYESSQLQGALFELQQAFPDTAADTAADLERLQWPLDQAQEKKKMQRSAPVPQPKALPEISDKAPIIGWIDDGDLMRLRAENEGHTWLGAESERGREIERERDEQVFATSLHLTNTSCRDTSSQTCDIEFAVCVAFRSVCGSV